jgi:phosphoglycolate phosphatase
VFATSISIFFPTCYATAAWREIKLDDGCRSHRLSAAAWSAPEPEFRRASIDTVKGLPAPQIILFDWHGTLVDTNDAMYRAMDDMLRQVNRLGLRDRLIEAEKSKTDDDRKLVEYVREHRRLHPKVISDRRASRTDLLELLFGDDEKAKDIANDAYNHGYRHHYGDVRPVASGVRHLLSDLRELGIRLGILTNRAREFLDRELETIEQGSWRPFFESTLSGSDTAQLKPSPAPVLRVLQDFQAVPGADVWYVGDSTSDTISANRAGITSVFFNGGRGDARWIRTIFPGTAAHPHRPDYVVDDYGELLQLVKQTMGHFV